jgi:ethanolaminephosphotransferase
MTSIPFFLNTWEEYYTGELNLPFIHGVSEGTVIACIAMAITGFYGQEFWLQYDNIFGLVIRRNHTIVSLCFSGGVFFGLISLINVFKTYRDKLQDAIENLLIFISLISTLCIVIIYAEADSVLIKEYPKVLIILYGFAFAKLVGHLQLAHICDSKFMQYRKSLLTSFVCLASVSLLNYNLGRIVINIDYLIVLFLIMHIVVWVHFAYYLTEEFCILLGIYRFSTAKRIQAKEVSNKNK